MGNKPLIRPAISWGVALGGTLGSHDICQDPITVNYTPEKQTNVLLKNRELGRSRSPFLLEMPP